MAEPIPNTSSRNRGFTLMELAITLAVIGLLVGGVIGGQQMIYNAKIRSVLSQVDLYKEAIQTYEDRYGSLPGDTPNASTLFGATFPNGDGNQHIRHLAGNPNNNGTDFSTPQGELASFFAMLAAAQLIPGRFSHTYVADCVGDTKNFPTFDWNGPARAGIAAYTHMSQHYLHLGIDPASNPGGIAFIPQFRPNEAHDIDRKVDDGNPLAGDYTVTQGNMWCAPGYMCTLSVNVHSFLTAPLFGAGADRCVRAILPTPVYNVGVDTSGSMPCSMRVRFGKRV
ncbi:MAG: prepilin-type N-terminal cleavage/methylation domain-containing protein [Alphaproteobacteria bacterium]|nr:prepilin-type N-terminal cleavage/methylation domain-containing protein [Alphaproteobacteria bacterium]